MQNADPFLAGTPAEVLLPRAPLVRVLAQARFPTITAIEQADFIAPVQEALRSQYPVLRPIRGQGVFLDALGASSPVAKPFTEWHFTDRDEVWEITLTPDFVTLQTRSYGSQAEFLSRLRAALEPVAHHIRPAFIDRLGVRYIDRLSGDVLGRLEDLVRIELRGITVGVMAKRVTHSITETVLNVNGNQLLARWGFLPPQATLDPTVTPISERSWVLDLDMFRAQRRDFSVGAVIDEARVFTDHIYSFFRWAVTEEFLREFGGEI